MKGLVLKDLYVTIKNQKLLLVLPFVFLAVALVDNNLFLLIYSTVFITMLPINLLALDENAKWNTFCGTLPVSKGQYVSGKMILNLITTGTVIAVIAVAEAVWMTLHGGFDPDQYTAMMVGIVFMAFLAPSVQYPFIFRFGADKGRVLFLAIFLTIGLSYSSIVEQVQPDVFRQINLPLAALVGAAVYGASWLLSIRMYEKRTK